MAAPMLVLTAASAAGLAPIEPPHAHRSPPRRGGGGGGAVAERKEKDLPAAGTVLTCPYVLLHAMDKVMRTTSGRRSQ